MLGVMRTDVMGEMGRLREHEAQEAATEQGCAEPPEGHHGPFITATDR
jgi:hypothetical protein